ncbi:MAG: hypothetical protein ACRDTS_05495 [Mycobacterium sp.]
MTVGQENIKYALEAHETPTSGSARNELPAKSQLWTQFEAERNGISFDEARRRQAASIAAGRLGRP